MANLKYYIYFLDKKILLEQENVYTIGRNINNLIQLPDQTTSRQHARILWQNKHFLIEDMNSTNGLFVNGQKCKDHILYDGDHISIGTFYLVYKEFDLQYLQEADFDNTLSDTLLIEHQIAELLKNISDKKIQNKILFLKLIMNKVKSKLDKLANRDRLTKLYNRRYFDEEFRKEFERAARYNYSLSFFMIDIDNFKSINDFHGHQKGDLVLTTVASIISENTRLNDLVARYGGEEIAILIPEMESNNSMYVAEKIRNRIEKDTIKKIGILVTVSIGGAFNKKNISSDNLIRKADKALYEAKKRGKNRVIINN